MKYGRYNTIDFLKDEYFVRWVTRALVPILLIIFYFLSPMITRLSQLEIAGVTKEIRKGQKINTLAHSHLVAVRQFADNVLAKGIDQWSGQNTPLLVNGINVETQKPVQWVYRNDLARKGKPNPLLMERWQGKDEEMGEPEEWMHPEAYDHKFTNTNLIFHNLASQQNLFRTLVGLTNLTGDEKYSLAAEESIRYHFDHLVSECGLLRWGRVQFIDLRTLQPVAPWRISTHGLKGAYPFYDLMWEVDSGSTAKQIRAYWNALIWDWNTLDMNRHGPYGLNTGELWNHEFDNPKPFFESAGLSFKNAGSDLIYSGLMLYSLNGEEGALKWAKLLAAQYVKARHPETGLGTYQYSVMRQTYDPSSPGAVPNIGNLGDRAVSQFGDLFPEVAREGWVLFNGSIYGELALAELEMADRLGEKGKDLLKWTVDGMKSFIKYGYIPEKNQFRPMWADGTDLSGFVFPRSGYYGPEGKVLHPYSVTEQFLFSYARAYRLSKDEYLWEALRQMFIGLGLGDPGTKQGQSIALNLKTENANPNTVFALLELHQAFKNPAHLAMAKVVGDNILKQKFHSGYFLPDEHHIYANFDAIEPLALLSLEAAIQDKPKSVPSYSGGWNTTRGYFGEMGDTSDDQAIWSKKNAKLLKSK